MKHNVAEVEVLGIDFNARITIPGLNRPGDFVCYPVSSTIRSWAIAQRDSSEAQETWKLSSAPKLLRWRRELLARFKD